MCISSYNIQVIHVIYFYAPKTNDTSEPMTYTQSIQSVKMTLICFVLKMNEHLMWP